jgi:hypothetical protein
MSEIYAEIIGRDGRRRRAKKGEQLQDGERMSIPMIFQDSGGSNVISVVDAAGLPSGHRPGFLFDCNTVLADSAGDAAYRERCERLDAKARKRRQADDEDDGDGADGRQQETEFERRQRLARKAAQATMGTDARQLTLDELREQVEIAY